MKINIMSTRKEKLNFLNDLKNGKTILKNFLPVQFGDVWFSSKDHLFLQHSKTGKIISRTEFEKRCEQDGMKPITFK